MHIKSKKVRYNQPLPNGWELRPMQTADIDAVLDIIADHDEDDGEAAAYTYRKQGVENHAVLAYEGRAAGGTGFRYVEAADNTYWLSWTYLARKYRGQGLGRYMVEALLDSLRKQNARKIFVSTSDYEDPQEGKIYEAAAGLYQALGFKLEAKHLDYYEPGEAQLIYGLPLRPINSDKTIADDDTAVYFNGLHEIEETDDVYVINWEAARKKWFSKPKQFTSQDLDTGIERAKKWHARSVFISFPSNMPGVLPPLRDSGFKEEGKLSDYYEDGLHELRFRYIL
ncbi:MAG: GNAT family N-acetyltransferase [Gammaproteobacteria bacterium]|nr:GNAT family N-acetyltransferase [Gammaproteobacteria bacterium]